jgi:hypothetical protein
MAPDIGARLIMAAAAREPQRVLVRFVMLWVLPRDTGLRDNPDRQR